MVEIARSRRKVASREHVDAYNLAGCCARGQVNTSVMVAPAAAKPKDSAKTAELTPVPRRFLLGLYWIVPIAIALPLLDRLLFNGAVQRGLPFHPDEIWIWTLVFNVPHLVASSLLLLDREYLTFYRRPLLWALGAVVVFWCSLFFVPAVPAFWIATAITTYHVLGQQIGILRMMGGGDPGPTIAPYRVLAVLTSLLAVNLMAPPGFRFELGVVDPRWLSLACACALTLCAWPMWRRLQGTHARSYLLANHVMFAAFIPLASTGYGFFFAIMPRVVHDLSAFSFYVVHDANRNRERPRGLLYKCLGFVGLPAWVLLPSISVGIGYLITKVNPGSLLQPVALISFFHYITEAVTWRRGALHRQSIAVR